MTFAPNYRADEYNLKICDPLDLTKSISGPKDKRIYSKDEFQLFRSLQSVVKPRMIYMLKEARDRKEEAIKNKKLKDEADSEKDDDDESGECQNGKDEISSDYSMPFDSDSDSVYEHCHKHFLNTDESMEVNMRYGFEAYHMK